MPLRQYIDTASALSKVQTVIIFFLDSAIVELLAILQFSIKLKFQNITKTHAVTWQLEEATDLF